MNVVAGIDRELKKLFFPDRFHSRKNFTSHRPELNRFIPGYDDLIVSGHVTRKEFRKLIASVVRAMCDATDAAVQGAGDAS